MIALSSDSGIDENSVDNSIITPEMLEEEQKINKENEKEAQKLRRLYEREKHAEEMKQLRYKRLIHLLDKSQFYANFMHEKVATLLAESNESKKKGKGKGKGKGKRKHDELAENYSNEMIDVCKKFKRNDDSYEKVKPISSISENTSTNLESKTDLKNEEAAVKIKSEDTNETRITSLGLEVPADQPILLEGAALRDYQRAGLEWLRLLFETGLNGILADEMGLGKTVQIIALICHLYEKNVQGPFLIVGPLSTLPNWSLEFANFAPQIPVILYHGTESSRAVLRRDIKKKSYINGKKAYPVVLTSYEIPARDRYHMKDIRWKYIIVDEGHRLKNYKSQLARTLSEFSTVNRLLLTGTPLQNNLMELWSLLHFLLPEVFDSLDAFQSWFQVEDIERGDTAERLIEQEKKDHILAVLHKILNPFLLRRVKAEVNLSLPHKKEVVVYCPLTKVQRKLYEALLDRSILKMMELNVEEDVIIPDNPDGTKVKRWSALRKNDHHYKCQSKADEQDGDMLVVDAGCDQYKFSVKIQNVPMMLRKVINHPYLIQMPVLPGSTILRIDEGLIDTSGKLIMLDGLLKRLKKNDHKVLVFSTFTTILDLLEEYMLMRDYKYERLDGNNKLEERKEAICRFNQDKDCFIFLISTRAGGLGINLTSADTVVIYDSDWNPQIDLQAQDRCHRIGQVRPVIVYRLVSKATIDEKIVTRAAAKRKLEKIIIHGGNFSHSKKAESKNIMDYEELKELLNNKQHSMEIHSDGSVLTEEQWETLLDRTPTASTS
ncbi:lymphoid-specific helicase isoform X2 [Halyomorpha halys]|nr:lymphoid-specific helicase-like isoform X2 [Halyomorpha halys]